MSATSYLLYGLILVLAMLLVIKYYYAKKRHQKVEEPKYRMLEDDE